MITTPVYLPGPACRIRVFGKNRQIIAEILLSGEEAGQHFWPSAVEAFTFLIQYGTVAADGKFTPCGNDE